MSGLPKKVLEQGAAADAALEALKEGKNPLGGSVKPPEGDEGTPNQSEGDPPTQPAAEATPDGSEEIDWKSECEKAIQRYNVLNGKYQAELPLLRNEVTDLKKKLAKYESGEAPAADPDTPESTSKPFEVPEDIKEMYGENLPQWVQDVAKAAATDAVAPLANKVENISSEGTRDRGQKFFDAIDTAHPDWETINGLDAFHSFLAEVPEELGTERQTIIEKAQREQNPEPIIAQISLFKKRYKAGSEQTRLESQVVPDDTGGSPPPNPESDVKIKESEIADFYARASRGAYKGNPKEFKRLEGMIRKAAESGNIIMDVTPPSPS